MPGFLQYSRFQLALWHQKEAGPSQKFGLFPSESHPVGLSFGKKLCCLFSTKLALLSPERILCSLTLCFRASVVVIIGLAHLKMVPSTVRIDKTQKPGHNILLSRSDANSSFSLALLLLFQEKTLMHPFIYRKQTNISWCACLLHYWRDPPKHGKQWTHPNEYIGLQHTFIHLHLVPTWVSCPGKCEGRQWNTNFREGKKARKKLVLWLLALLYKARKKVTILHRM